MVTISQSFVGSPLLLEQLTAGFQLVRLFEIFLVIRVVNIDLVSESVLAQLFHTK